MLKQLIARGARSAARIVERAAGALAESAVLLRLGPRRYAQHRQTVVAAGSGPGATYAQGVTTTLTPARAAAWHRLNWKHVVVVVYGTPVDDVRAWLRRGHGLLRAHFLLTPEIAAHAGEIPVNAYTVAAGTGDAPAIDLAEIHDWMHRERRRWDLVLIDASQPLPPVETIVQLQHAAYEYHHDQEIGFVTPAYAANGSVAAGYQIDRRTGAVAPSLPGERDYGQSRIPRYVLTAAAHGLYATSTAIDRVDIARRHLAGLDLDAQVGRLVRHGWAGNFRTLCFSTTVMPVRTLPQLKLEGEQRRWLLERQTTTDAGTRRVIFVLNATSISGGIRIVFELANGLADRGFEVEIWSLQDAPTWFDLRVPVAMFRNYEDLLLSLRNEDAVKVATWWETAEVVWLATVSHGIPVYLVQEFETWFYPDDPVAQAAVVASYRREHLALTEATYQREELAEVGLQTTLIPNGYDPDVFHEIPGWQRDERTVLALGRSFFQKNFAMTERAWRRLGEDRPTLLLFGSEPDIVTDPRVDYRLLPRDAQVNELYNTATLFVQTSRHEGFCLPILEAMAAGCPVITTDSHGNRDFCRDGENCVVVPQDDDAALAAAITRLLDDPAERERLSRAGLATAAQYRWPDVLNSVADFYGRVAGAGSAGVPLTERADERPETPA
ncbi:glycosyltransferase [Microbacterium atlanticum]|uniref:glycosyltransferase n=1 Tax=Microbacterium atlanticum TaxID=2782168 RepID=UPI001888C538|nr:glycosyltransferase [Microbacterium atlanticum]